jgi:hypothetical protein
MTAPAPPAPPIRAARRGPARRQVSLRLIEDDYDKLRGAVDAFNEQARETGRAEQSNYQAAIDQAIDEWLVRRGLKEPDTDD